MSLFVQTMSNKRGNSDMEEQLNKVYGKHHKRSVSRGH